MAVRISFCSLRPPRSHQCQSLWTSQSPQLFLQIVSLQLAIREKDLQPPREPPPEFFDLSRLFHLPRNESKLFVISRGKMKISKDLLPSNNARPVVQDLRKVAQLLAVKELRNNALAAMEVVHGFQLVRLQLCSPCSVEFCHRPDM